jgi:hypothetical protein
MVAAGGTFFTWLVEADLMTDLDAETLFPNDRTIDAVLEGEMTQIHRGQQHASEGDTFEIDGARFEVVDVTDRTLGDLTDEDARREGSSDLDAYKTRMERAHGGEFEWNDDAAVVRHRVERINE